MTVEFGRIPSTDMRENSPRTSSITIIIQSIVGELLALQHPLRKPQAIYSNYQPQATLQRQRDRQIGNLVGNENDNRRHEGKTVNIEPGI